MAFDEFQIPKEYNQTEIRAEINSIQNTLDTLSVEKEKAPFQLVKDVENKVFAYRDAQLEAVKKPASRRGRGGWLSGLIFSPQNRTAAELINEESRMGGRIFGKDFKFWLDMKPSDSVFINNVADWYFMQNNQENPKQPTVLRFQTTPYSIHKLYDGVEHAPSIEELKTFISAVELYPSQVLPLYPVDQTLEELTQEDVAA